MKALWSPYSNAQLGSRMSDDLARNRGTMGLFRQEEQRQSGWLR